MSRTLPPLIESLRETVNAGDTEAFLALFAEDAPSTTGAAALPTRPDPLLER